MAGGHDLVCYHKSKRPPAIKTIVNIVSWRQRDNIVSTCAGTEAINNDATDNAIDTRHVSTHVSLRQG